MFHIKEEKPKETQSGLEIMATNRERALLLEVIMKQDMIAFETYLKQLTHYSAPHLEGILVYPIMKIIELDHLEMMDTFLKHTPNLTGISGINRQIFRFSAAEGSLSMIKKMLQCGADPLEKTKRNGVDAIKVALIRGDLAVIELLWDNNPKISRVKKSREYLVAVANRPSKKSVKVAEYLLKKGMSESEMIDATQKARHHGANELSDFIEGYRLALMERKLLKQSVKEATAKRQRASPKAKRSARI